MGKRWLLHLKTLLIHCVKESDYLDLMYSLHKSLIKDLQYLAEGFEHQQELKMSTIVTFPEAIRIYRELTSSKFKMN